VWWAACREAGRTREGPRSSTTGGGPSIRPGSRRGPAMGPVLDALDQALTPRTRLVVLARPPCIGTPSLVIAVDRSGWPSAGSHHHSRHPGLRGLRRCRPVRVSRSLPVGGRAASAGPISTAFQHGHIVCLRSRGWGGVSLSRSESSAHQDRTRGGIERSLAQMRTMPALMLPGWCHDPWATNDGSPLRVATSCASLMARVFDAATA